MLRIAARRLTDLSPRLNPTASSFIRNPIHVDDASDDSRSFASSPLHFGFQWPSLVASGDSVWRKPSINPTSQQLQYPYSLLVKSRFSSQTNEGNSDPTDTVKEMHEKISNSIEAKSSPPNSWLWSLIENCSNEKDIAVLFQTLQNLRRFRLSTLRISSNFNSHLCERVTEACARVSAFDYGMKALWKHNIYGLTPNIASAHHLLRRAEEKKNYKLMEKVMEVLQKNELPLQPGTADIVFRICHHANKWDLITKYSRKFMKHGVKLHHTSFDTWMEFAANKGDAASIWKIEKLRSISCKQHSLSSAFSCAKGFLLERNVENATAVIHSLDLQNLSDRKKSITEAELQKLSKWSSEVIKQHKGDKEALASSLRNDISVMISSLTSKGLEVMVNLEELKHANVNSKRKLAA